MNKYICIGRLGFDPDPIQGGCKVRLAVDTFGGKTKKVVWITALIFGNSGSNVLSYKSKGDKILLEGRIDRNAKDELVVVSDNVDFL